MIPDRSPDIAVTGPASSRPCYYCRLRSEGQDCYTPRSGECGECDREFRIAFRRLTTHNRPSPRYA